MNVLDEGAANNRLLLSRENYEESKIIPVNESPFFNRPHDKSDINDLVRGLVEVQKNLERGTKTNAQVQKTPGGLLKGNMKRDEGRVEKGRVRFEEDELVGKHGLKGTPNIDKVDSGKWNEQTPTNFAPPTNGYQEENSVRWEEISQISFSEPNEIPKTQQGYYSHNNILNQDQNSYIPNNYVPRVSVQQQQPIYHTNPQNFAQPQPHQYQQPYNHYLQPATQPTLNPPQPHHHYNKLTSTPLLQASFYPQPTQQNQVPPVRQNPQFNPQYPPRQSTNMTTLPYNNNTTPNQQNGRPTTSSSTYNPQYLSPQNQKPNPLLRSFN